MPSAQPTCAARIIRNKFLKYGWGATLTKETNDAVASVMEDAGAMYQLQILSDRAVSSTSLRSAVFWEHHHLSKQSIISTPSIDDELEIELFSSQDEGFEAGLDKIRKSISECKSIQMHPIFEAIRNRRYTVWPIRIDGVWVTIILEIDVREIDTETKVYDLYCDREVRRFAIIDSFSHGQEDRRKVLEARLPRILEQGCIMLPPDARTENFLKSPVETIWQTGYVAFAVCREFIRRLKVLLYRTAKTSDSISTDYLWSEFEEELDFNGYRQLLMANCANHTIEKSGYIVRMALEVPSEKSDHKPHNLMPKMGNLPDEVYGRTHYTIRDTVVCLPEGWHESPALPKTESDQPEVDMADAKESGPEPRHDEAERLGSTEPTERLPGACKAIVEDYDDMFDQDSPTVEDTQSPVTFPQTPIEEPLQRQEGIALACPLPSVAQIQSMREESPLPDYVDEMEAANVPFRKRPFDDTFDEAFDDEDESAFKRQRFE